MRFSSATGEHRITAIEDEYGFEVENTPMGEMRTVAPVKLVGANFEGAVVDTNFWTATTAATGTVAQGSSQIVLTSGINAAANAALHSNRRGRYVGGSALMFRAVVQLGDTGIADNVRRWGVAYGAAMPLATDGAWFELNGTTFRIVVMRGGVPTVVNNGTFNGHIGATWTVDTNIHTFEIYWTNSTVWFSIGDDLLHTFSSPVQTWATTMNHYINLSNTNYGNTTSVSLYCRVATLRRLGPLLTQPTSRRQSGTTAGLVLKYGAGNLHTMTLSAIANNSVVTLYDNTAAAVPIIFSSGTMPPTAVPFTLHFSGLPFSTGLTLAITAATADAVVVYE